MEIALFVTGSLSLLTWLYLVFLRAGFWRADQQLDDRRSEPEHWPDVAILIATRDDAEAIEETLPDLLEQAYPGLFISFLSTTIAATAPPRRRCTPRKWPGPPSGSAW